MKNLTLPAKSCKRLLVASLLLSLFTFHLSPLSAQTYVWKGGHPLVTDPDSITFVEPDLGAQVEAVKGATFPSYDFRYLTQDHAGRPVWQSARIVLTEAQANSKTITKMALYNHYTIGRSDECPTEGLLDLQSAAVGMGYATVSADYEGFGETGDRPQAYCYGLANARASMDALIAVREWLIAQGFTLGDTLINFGYSQGAQTTIAALRLSQTEYKSRVHFMKSIAGAGPYDLSMTYKTFIKWEKIAQPVVLPMFIIAANELEGLGLKYKEIFKAPLSSNVKSWVLSKKFSTNEITPLIGYDSLKYFMQPIYMDSTSAEVQRVLEVVAKQDITTGWTPDADTDLKIYHSLNDDIVPAANSVEMHHFFVGKGVPNAVLDTTSLTAGHLTSGQMFLFMVAQDLMNFNKK